MRTFAIIYQDLVFIFGVFLGIQVALCDENVSSCSKEK